MSSLTSFPSALITGGIALAYWVNYGFWFVDQNSFQWRFPIAFQAVFGLMLIFGVLLYPESPRWLIKHGQPDAAKEILAVLEDKSPDDPAITADVKEMVRVNEIVSAKKLTAKELFSNGKEMNLWRLSVACLSQAFQQLGGLNLVTCKSWQGPFCTFCPFSNHITPDTPQSPHTFMASLQASLTPCRLCYQCLRIQPKIRS